MDFTRMIGAALYPSKRERKGFVTQQIGTHRIVWKITPHQEFYVK